MPRRLRISCRARATSKAFFPILVEARSDICLMALATLPLGVSSIVSDLMYCRVERKPEESEVRFESESSTSFAAP